MSLNAKERGWGDPRRRDFRAKNIVPVRAAGITLYVHNGIRYLVEIALLQVSQMGYRFDQEADDWGFIVRPVRGKERQYARTKSIDLLSNHSWGTAIDLNAKKNPMLTGRRLVTDIPPRVRKVFKDLGFSWGGDYKGDRLDPMHFEYLGTLRDAMIRTAQVKKYLTSIGKGK